MERAPAYPRKQTHIQRTKTVGSAEDTSAESAGSHSNK